MKAKDAPNLIFLKVLFGLDCTGVITLKKMLRASAITATKFSAKGLA